jgi:hypothetical protein
LAGLLGSGAVFITGSSVDQDQEQYGARNDEPPVQVPVNQYGVKSVHPPARTKHRSLRDPIAAALADNHGCRSFTWKRKTDGRNHIASLSEKTTEIWRALVSLEAQKLGVGKVLELAVEYSLGQTNTQRLAPTVYTPQIKY